VALREAAARLAAAREEAYARDTQALAAAALAAASSADSLAAARAPRAPARAAAAAAAVEAAAVSSAAAHERRSAGGGARVGGGAPARGPSLLSRLFAYVEVERVAARDPSAGGCPAADQRRALTCLLLAILVPPAAYLYYGYVAVGAVSILLYLLCLTPLCFACGWFCRPVLPKYRAGAEPSVFESFSPAVAEEIGSRTRVLFVLILCAGILFVALIMWQVALVVRVATNDFPPANGCPAVLL